MNKITIAVIAVLVFLSGGFWGWFITSNQLAEQGIIGPTISPTPTPKPLLVFTFEALAKREYRGSQIEIGETLDNEDEGYSAQLFSFYSDGKKVTGQINFPLTEKSNKLPVIVLLRGWANQETYRTGSGTEKAAAVFAQNGYITLAPDFLGYGGSDNPENDVWWERFNNPVVVLNLLASIKTLPQADPERVGIWAHSNGGQIALSALAISQLKIPTTLWAPVTKPFPYSILYFTDTFEDEGQALRAEICRLEKDYNVADYSLTNYLDRIKAPLQIHQGTADKSVPVSWSDELVEKLDKLKIDYQYSKHYGADHNLVGAWNEAIEQDLEFFEKELAN
ncbi:MAG: Peptidase [Microgenomates bacterium 39_6]|nr:MAG: Peptidase [Microgenomates bacterium 39_6]